MSPLNRINASPVKVNNAVKIHHDLFSDPYHLIWGPPAIQGGAINQEQMVIGADLSQIQDDYLDEIDSLRTQFEGYQRGVIRDYTVAGIALTPAAVANTLIPDYETPAPIYGNWILVNGDDTATNGIYDRTTGLKIGAFDFPVGTQVFVDQTNEVFRVNTEPVRDANGAVTDVTLEPWIRFTPYTDQGALHIIGQEISVDSNESRIVQVGRQLDFSPETEAELQGLHDADTALQAENQRQQTAIDGHTQSITTVQQVNTQQQTAINGHTQDIATVQQVNTQQQTAIDGHTQQITAIQQVDTQQQTAIDGHAQDITAIQLVDTQQNNRIVGLQATVDDHTGQISVLTTRENQVEARVNGIDTTLVQIQSLDTTQNGQIQDIYTQLNTKDTPALRDAAILEDIQAYAALNFPEIALITGDNRIQATYNSALDETVFTITGMQQGAQLAGIYDPNGYGAQILKPRRIDGGTTLNFAIKDNVSLAGSANTAWKVCVSVHSPLNFSVVQTPTPTPSPTPSPTPTPASNPNLLLNPGFEDGGNNWTIDGNAASITSAPEEVFAGSNSGKISGPPDGWIEQMVVNLQPNTDYVFSAWVKCQGTSSSDPCSIRVYEYGGTDKYTYFPDPHSNYVLATVTFTTGSTNTSAKVFAYMPANGSQTLLVDNLSLTQA